MKQIDLGLSMSKVIENGEFTIVLILVVLCAAVFFCHSVLRLLLLVFRRDVQSRGMRHVPQYANPGGYAVPQEPIPVVLARDEEAQGASPAADKVALPAYGLWRGSVVRIWALLDGLSVSELTEVTAGRSRSAVLATQRRSSR